METANPKTVLRGEAGRRLGDELLLDILDHAPDAVGIVEAVPSLPNTYVFVYVNAAFEPLYGAKKSEVIGAHVADFFSTRAMPEDLTKTLAVMAEGKPFTNTRTFARPDGNPVWIEVNYRPIARENQPIRWIFIARDVTAKKMLQDRAAQLSIAVEEGNDLVAISTADFDTGVWRFDYVNEAFVRTTGYRPEEIIGRTLASIVPPGTASRIVKQTREDLFAGKPVRDEVEFVHKNGTIGTFVINAKPIVDPITGKFTSIVTIFRDVTEERLHEAQLQYEAEHDPLTGLHNRRYFERMLGDSIAMQPPQTPQHALLFIDLDGFKAINDRYGHDVGDRVLKEAAEAFKRCIAGSDVLVRWGGDEFAAILFHCHIASAERIASGLLQELRNTPGCWGVTASIGAVPVLPGEMPASSIRRADMAAYEAKSRGGDTVAVRDA